MSKRENIYDLPIFKVHVLLLADIVAEFSGKTELVDTGKLKKSSFVKVHTAKAPTAKKLRLPPEITTDAVLERALDRKETQAFEVQMTPEERLISTKPNIRICGRAERLSAA